MPQPLALHDIPSALRAISQSCDGAHAGVESLEQHRADVLHCAEAALRELRKHYPSAYAAVREDLAEVTRLAGKVWVGQT